MDQHQHTHSVNYFMVFIALCVCTSLSVIFDVVEFNSKVLLIFLVFGIAAAKALFVLTYFMHLKFEGNWKFVLLAPTIILAMGIPLALLPDIGVHYYTVDVPQQVEVQAGYGAEGAHADETADSDTGH